ncbi:flavin reductase family protein [Streptococcus suis]|nr:flavin reductase family protein [Streptococcus suis]
MTKQLFDTPKFYYGFPVFILGYKDEQFGYNITTCSSSYSLGDMVVVGMFQGSNAVEQIAKYGEFTLNIPSLEQAYMMEKAGFLHKREKLRLLDVEVIPAERIDAPILDACPITLECRVKQVHTFDSYTNFTARILRRTADETLLDEKGNFKSLEFDPLIYMGDGRERIYRYLEKGSSVKLGSFIKKGRNE